MEYLLNLPFGRGLVRVDSPRLTGRYNDCLEAAGIERTSLHSFRIDATGWSPEIAAEKADIHYLSQGEATQLMIIVTPDQRDKPVFFSQFSFERLIARSIFEKYREEIADITSDAALWLEIELGMSHFRTPADLLLLHNAVVRVSCVGPVMEAAHKQKELVNRFLEPTSAWFDSALREEILKSAVEHGDLRRRRLDVPDTAFERLENFSANIFGGVFVFRELRARKALLIVPEEFAEADAGGATVLSITSPELIPTLMEEGLVDFQGEFYANRTEDFIHLWECLLAETITNVEKDIHPSSLTAVKRKGLIRKHKASFSEEFFDLERLIAQCRIPGFVIGEDVSPSLRRMLLHPSAHLQGHVRQVVWQLLCRLCPVDFVRAYRRDRDFFFEQYSRWPDNKRQWAMSLIETLMDEAGR